MKTRNNPKSSRGGRQEAHLALDLPDSGVLLGNGTLTLSSAAIVPGHPSYSLNGNHAFRLSANGDLANTGGTTFLTGSAAVRVVNVIITLAASRSPAPVPPRPPTPCACRSDSPWAARRTPPTRPECPAVFATPRSSARKISPPV